MRIFSSAFVVVVFAFILTGCGDVDVNTRPAPAAPAAPTVIIEKKDRPVIIEKTERPTTVIVEKNERERPTVIEKKTEINLPGGVKKTETIERK